MKRLYGALLLCSGAFVGCALPSGEGTQGESTESVGQGTRRPKQAPGKVRRRLVLLDGCRRLGRHESRHYSHSAR